MWLVVITLAAVVVTAVWYLNDKARTYYKVGLLNLMLWGTAIMVFVDHMMGYLDEGGDFIETTTEAMLLSVTLILTVLIIWGLIVMLKNPKRLLKSYIK